MDDQKWDLLTSTLNRIEAAVEKQNGRVDKLEQWRAGIVAIGAVLVFLVPLALKYLL